MNSIRLALAALVVGLVASSASAGDVKIKGVHLCCGACVNAAQKALKDIEGVSGVAVDRDSKLVAFKSADEKSTKAAIEALAKEGMFGTATDGDKAVAFPESGAKKGDTADIVTLSSIHLCCGQCVTDAKTAATTIEGVTGVDVDRNGGTVKLTGKNIDVVAAVAAMNKAGFNAVVKKK
ncbi:MAG: cation transporter [Planctomycetaceae bacterium]|nr:cation transporter [Planctomycetaceae bacterium]